MIVRKYICGKIFIKTNNNIRNSNKNQYKADYYKISIK